MKQRQDISQISSESQSGFIPYSGALAESLYPNNRVYLMDCMDALRQTPDKYYRLSIVDPPYGIGESGKTNKSRSKLAVSKDYGDKDWDTCSPNNEYFRQLFRVSKNQIVFGANHYISKMPFDSPCWVVWDKVNGDNDFADCELAWTSFKSAVRQVTFMWHGFMQGGDYKGGMNPHKHLNETRIHPTQKPVALYDWLLKNYAKPGDKILDTHIGSGSIRIACHKAGYDLTGFELDKDYFDAQEKRYQEFLIKYNQEPGKEKILNNQMRLL